MSKENLSSIQLSERVTETWKAIIRSGQFKDYKEIKPDVILPSDPIAQYLKAVKDYCQAGQSTT